ncbi:MAG TPA: transglutaminase domain-containing protein [Baekduia sp.]
MTALPGAARRTAPPVSDGDGRRVRSAVPAAVGSPAWIARLAATAALALDGALHWGGIVRPGAPGALLGTFVVAMAAALVLPSALAVAGRAARTAAVAGLLLVALALILAIAGVPVAALRPDRWDTLTANLANGIGTLPALRMPYRGVDPWVRAVLLSGGGLLVLLGAALALAPRPRVYGAALVLGVLYVVPIVEHAPDHPYLDGALFALLLGVLLWADRLNRREAPVAAAIAVVAVLAAALVAPHVDSGKPWVDYEALAESLQSGKSTTFTWNHDYAPLTWPRDGLELARVRTRGDLYLKTADLETFGGGAWKQSRAALGGRSDDTEFAPGHPDWMQTIHVTIKGLRTEQFLGAGTTMLVSHSTKAVQEATPGTFQASDKPLRRNDSYDALVYVPKPGTVAMHRAGFDYPNYVMRDLALDFPQGSPGGAGPVEVDFPAWGADLTPMVRSYRGYPFLSLDEALDASGYRRDYELAQQLRNGSADPYDFVLNTMARVNRDARYTESPPPPGKLPPLDAFLFRDHAGYCQHFAGATALLLRMGGVPARVVAGFAPGSRDGKDHIVRDLDAHSWVEVYFPHIGWVTFDPTPGDSPARGQQTDLQTASIPASTTSRSSTPTRDRPARPAADGATVVNPGDDSDLALPLTLGGLALALVGSGSLLAIRRRRRLERSGDPEVEELRLALVRCGRPPAPDMTLAHLEHLLDGSEDALGYLRALRLRRYGRGGPPPTAAQRRALRHELGVGLGLRGWLRSVWALPPHPRELLAALKPRRRRSYTA